MTVRILQGDCRDVLATLPADSVHCCVTSPPYWGLRDYGVAGAIGLESTFTEFIDQMVKVFREVRRVLRPDGTLWLNLGDSYVAGHGGSTTAGNYIPKVDRHREAKPRERPDLENAPAGWAERDATPKRIVAGMKPKDLCGIPWRVALALQEDGWWLRQDIVWSKPNPMPESVQDRCTKAHEYLFLLSKSPRYYFDAEAIKETAVADHPPGNKSHKGAAAYEAGASEHRTKAGLIAYSERQRPIVSDDRKALQGAGESRHRSSIDGGQSLKAEPNGTRNKRSVWEIATSPFSEAHFATFPPALVEPCIRAGTSEKGCCRVCGAPWVREVEVETVRAKRERLGLSMELTPGEKAREKAGLQGIGGGNSHDGNRSPTVKTLGWSPTCTCQAPVVPCTVLDPFGGAGTTGLVADRLQRNAVLIELSPSYAAMAEKRIHNDAPLFADMRAAE